MDWLLAGGLGDGGALTWTATEPVRVVVLVAASLALGVAALPGHVKRPLGGRLLELALWAGAIGTLALAALGPTWVDESGRTETGPLVVLVDGSASMGVTEQGRARSEALRERLDALVEDAAADGPVDVYTFDEAVRSGPPAELDGRGTDLGVALEATADRYLGQQVRGVVVLTDGIDRGALRRSLQESGADGTLDPGLAPPLPGPLTIYQVGDLDEVKDLAIDDVVTGGFAFLRTPFTLTARVRGAPGRTVPVSLLREGRVQQQRDVTLGEDGRGEVAFEVTPRRVGRFAWELSVPVEPGDAVPGNNRFPVVVRVVRDRTRVLQVSGSPSYDQKFLRLFLKEDPSVDLVSFFILRTREDMGAGWSGFELSLIEFPYERLFSEDLGSFDLVVLQNFDYAPYFSYNAEELLGNLARYVEDGGALVMTGGDRSFDLGDYQGTPLERVLPVQLGVAGRKADEVAFRPALTPAGLQHPITRLAPDAEASQQVWERLQPMDGLNLTAGAAPGAAVLLQHPEQLAANGQPAPVLAVAEVGRGRTMALTVDASWRWSFSEAAVGRGNQAYLRFWKSAVRWLVADPDDRRVVVTPARDNVLLGDEVQVVVLARDAGHLPVPGAEIGGTLLAPDGTETPFTAKTDEIGEATLTFRPESTGAHRVEAALVSDPGQAGASVFAVSDRDPELSEIAPDRGFLENLAALYGDAGRYVAPGASDDPLVDDTAVREVRDRREVDLASAPLVALLFGLLASGAWFLRRRQGAV
jgi:uncharacterized membrane protein